MEVKFSQSQQRRKGWLRYMICSPLEGFFVFLSFLGSYTGFSVMLSLWFSQTS